MIFRSQSIVIGLLLLTLTSTSAMAMYHPRMGRFMQRDPSGYADGSNTYQYLRSAPSRFLDPDGEKTIDASTSVPTILAELRSGIRAAESRGLMHMTFNLRHWLGGAGRDVWHNSTWVKSDPLVKRSIRKFNRFYWPKTVARDKKEDLDAGKWVTDHWDNLISYSKYAAAVKKRPKSEFAYAFGDATLQGQGIFQCDPGGSGLIKGFSRYILYDRYNFHSGLQVTFPGRNTRIKDDAMLKLQRAGHGKDFWMFSMWITELECKKDRTAPAFGYRCSEVSQLRTYMPSPMLGQVYDITELFNVSYTPPLLPPGVLWGRTIDWGGVNIVSDRHFGKHPIFIKTRNWKLK